MVMTTGEFIHPDHWNITSQRPKKSYKDHRKLTILLDRMEAKAKEVHLTLRAEFTTITPGILRDAIKREIATGGERETMLKYAENHFTGQWASTYTLLKSFPGAKDWNDVNARWFEKFQRYMEGRKENYTANYIGRVITNIREMMIKAVRDGATKYTGWKDIDYKPPYEEVDNIYLTVDELLKIHNADLTDDLRTVADRFLIGCFTGLRYSDFTRLTLESMASGMIRNRNKKTGELVVIPIHPVVSEILARYPGGMPKATGNSGMNRKVKLIGKQAGIKEIILKSTTRGGKRTTQAFQKWQLITTHTARRSAATNMYIAGIPAISIMKITGHRTEKSFLKYIKISQEENARLISTHPFYAPSSD